MVWEGSVDVIGAESIVGWWRVRWDCGVCVGNGVFWGGEMVVVVSVREARDN